MNIISYQLSVLIRHEDQSERSIDLIYRGNENILIKSYVVHENEVPSETEPNSWVKVPRHLLESFIKMIEI